jgi:hypothetical protein
MMVPVMFSGTRFVYTQDIILRLRGWRRTAHIEASGFAIAPMRYGFFGKHVGFRFGLS